MIRRMYEVPEPRCSRSRPSMASQRQVVHLRIMQADAVRYMQPGAAPHLDSATSLQKPVDQSTSQQAACPH